MSFNAKEIKYTPKQATTVDVATLLGQNIEDDISDDTQKAVYLQKLYILKV